jgi:hypothetical protein
MKSPGMGKDGKLDSSVNFKGNLWGSGLGIIHSFSPAIVFLYSKSQVHFGLTFYPSITPVGQGLPWSPGNSGGLDVEIFTNCCQGQKVQQNSNFTKGYLSFNVKTQYDGVGKDIMTKRSKEHE